MAVLHVVNRPQALASCLGAAADEDVVLLIEDGVYAGVRAPAIAEIEHQLCAIDIDVRARGIAERMGERVTIVTYADFVQLAQANNPIVTWR
jgi:sulfur relay protein TusB/DsrH